MSIASDYMAGVYLEKNDKGEILIKYPGEAGLCVATYDEIMTVATYEAVVGKDLSA